MGFQQGLSGLNAASRSLDVTGNNVANASTVGFKQSRAEFADIYASSLNGSGAVPIGLGAKVAAVTQQFTQGGISVTNLPLDMAINGGGFFRMSGGTGGETGTITYTRNGQFQLDKNGYIVNAQGFRLQGYLADSNGTVQQVAPPVNLRLFNPATSSDVVPQATGGSTAATGIEAVVNLDSREAVPTTPTFSYSDPTSYNRATAVSIYDSLGNAHTYQMYFVKQAAAGTWDVYATMTNPTGAVPSFTNLSDAAETAVINAIGTATTPAAAAANITAATAAIDAVGGAGAAAAASAAAGAQTTLSAAFSAATGAVTATAGPTAIGTLTFNTSGAITSAAFNETLTAAELGYAGAVTTPLAFPVNFAGSTQFGATFKVNSLAQDGYTSGSLSGYSVGADGVIVGRYTNGQTKNLGQVTLDSFRNPQGLDPVGNNQWVETSESGSPITGEAGTDGNHGPIQSAATEDSNVDLTQELVNMIITQRVYQANAQTIKTQDSILQTLVNLR